MRKQYSDLTQTYTRYKRRAEQQFRELGFDPQLFNLSQPETVQKGLQSPSMQQSKTIVSLIDSHDENYGQKRDDDELVLL